MEKDAGALQQQDHPAAVVNITPATTTTPQAKAGAVSMAHAAIRDAGTLQQQEDHSAAVGNNTPATTTTTTTTTLMDTQQTKAGGVSIANCDVERDAGTLQQQDAPATTTTTVVDTPEANGGGGGVSMATREEELGGRVVNLGDDVAAGAVSQPKCPNLRGILRVAENRRVLMSVIPTLTLAIMGGAVLPVAWAFSVTGITAGFLIMVVVASANAFTCDLLLRQALVTGTLDYESLGLAVAGPVWRLTTEISIAVLLLGSITGGIAQIGEAGASGLISIWPNDVPDALINGEGRLLMVFVTALVIWPLCCVSRLRQLEYAAMAGTVIVLWLMGVTVVEGCINGLPAIADRELAPVGFSSIGLVSQAVSVFGFAFYVQPVIMPLLGEMPEGPLGVKLTSYSTRVVVLVNSFAIYGATGFFGAASYGANTQQNILENKWLGGGVAQGILNLSMTLYLAFSMPMLEYPTRHTINGWIPESLTTNKRLRHLVVMTTILTFCLVIAVIWPAKSGSMLVVTGATGVCMVSYIIPVVNHLLLYYSRSKIQRLRKREHERDPESKQWNLIVYRRDRKPGRKWLLLEILREVFVPILVLVVGVFCSAASLTTL